MLHVISSLKHLQWTPPSSPDTFFNLFLSPCGWFTKHTHLNKEAPGLKRAKGVTPPLSSHTSEGERESRWISEKILLEGEWRGG